LTLQVLCVLTFTKFYLKAFLMHNKLSFVIVVTTIEYLGGLFGRVFKFFDSWAGWNPFGK